MLVQSCCTMHCSTSRPWRLQPESVHCQPPFIPYSTYRINADDRYVTRVQRAVSDLLWLIRCPISHTGDLDSQHVLPIVCEVGFDAVAYTLNASLLWMILCVKYCAGDYVSPTVIIFTSIIYGIGNCYASKWHESSINSSRKINRLFLCISISGGDLFAKVECSISLPSLLSLWGPHPLNPIIQLGRLLGSLWASQWIRSELYRQWYILSWKSCLWWHKINNQPLICVMVRILNLHCMQIRN